MDYRKVMSLDMEILTQLKNALVSTSCVSLGLPLEFISFPSKIYFSYHQLCAWPVICSTKIRFAISEID